MVDKVEEEDRRKMALFAIGLWHNVFAVRVVG
ncbi:hypothetical protein Asulf_01953 [Archaeoglobus sulfaticallidus PM70-1]|uniref:Uncharacterized protein n=1 Tax=Archaeoglobus sulfaticallidus PM70-1 TaxID=387631 RepID=N0BE65_9EURY|nr:hypothetical protein Asulf_01953 [Archaeoglobus sulfaticallidus PM70-1]